LYHYLSSMKAVLLVCTFLLGAAVAQNLLCQREHPTTPCSRCDYTTQDALDRCYMREALRFGKTLNPSRPYGALIVDSSKNTISCYGVNTASTDVLLHGEMAAFRNCTALYPSPTGDDRNNPGLFWPNQTMYTTAESCPMCAAASVWRGLGRMVYGTDIPTLARLGSKQMTIRNRELYASNILSIFKTGSNGAVNSNFVPFLAEGVLKQQTDKAFYEGFGFAYPPDSRIGTKEDVFSTCSTYAEFTCNSSTPVPPPTPCQQQWECQGVSVDYNYVQCSSGACQCKAGFSGQATVDNKCSCISPRYVTWSNGEAFCLSPGQCRNSYDCNAYSDNSLFVSCNGFSCACKAGFSGTATPGDKCRCEHTLTWTNGVPTCA